MQWGVQQYISQIIILLNLHFFYPIQDAQMTSWQVITVLYLLHLMLEWLHSLSLKMVCCLCYSSYLLTPWYTHYMTKKCYIYGRSRFSEQFTLSNWCPAVADWWPWYLNSQPLISGPKLDTFACAFQHHIKDLVPL